MRVVLISPIYDKTTEITAEWAEHLKLVLPKGLEILHLTGPEATRRNIEKVLSDIYFEISAVLFYGHGQHDSWQGGDGKPVVDLYNSYLLHRKFVFAMTCRSGRDLGMSAIQEGGSCLLWLR